MGRVGAKNQHLECPLGDFKVAIDWGAASRRLEGSLQVSSQRLAGPRARSRFRWEPGAVQIILRCLRYETPTVPVQEQ